MAATVTSKLITTIEGLGKILEFAESWSQTTTATRKVENYQVQATADTAEALQLGDVTTIHTLVLKAVSKNVAVDTSYLTTFSTEFTVPEGEVIVITRPGTVYLKNATATETFTVEYIASGV